MFTQILSLVAAQFNNSKVVELKSLLTQEEWDKKQITKNTLLNLGLKGSPKLSKVLVALGLPSQVVQTILSGGSSKAKTTTSILSSPEDCLDQGNSIHYSSCQANDPRAKSSFNPNYNKIEEDLSYIGKSLFLWVVGEPMRINGEGFKARAKLRVVYTDSTCSKIAGLFVDKIYGQKGLLESNYHELEEWWKQRGEITPILHTGNKVGGFVPSALGGYQDTFKAHTSYYFSPKRNSLLSKAYRSRLKMGGTYVHSIKEVIYNPQAQESMTAPKYETKEWRGFIPDFLRPIIKHFYTYIGKPEQPINYRKYRKEESMTIIKNILSGKECRLTCKDKKVYEFTVEDKLVYRLNTEEGLLQVWQGYEELGYISSEKLPYAYSNNKLRVNFSKPDAGFLEPMEFPYRKHKGALIVHTSYPKEGWAKAEEFPYQAARGRLRVTKDLPEYGWMRAEPLLN
jgi:hypothetical protein